MRRRILLVDDDKDVLTTLRGLLWKLRDEIEVVFALGGETALDELTKGDFDVVVSDMVMPGMDGATLLQRVRDEYPDIVRISLSGYAEQEVGFRALPVAHQFLGKPCNAETFRNVINRACRLCALLSDRSLRQALGSVDHLPSLPAVYHELMRAMAQPYVSARTLAKIFEKDPALCAKLLQLVNSACFGPVKYVTRIDQAVAYLGIQLIKNLVLTVNVFAAFDKATSKCGISFEALQEHSLMTARLASRLTSDPNRSQEAFTAGLLHDIGIVALELCAPEGSDNHNIDASTTHASAGAYLLGLWGLPYPTVEAVAFHHQPELVNETTFDLTWMVHVADGLVHEAMGNAAGLVGHSGIDMARLNALGVASRLPEWSAIAEEEVDLWHSGAQV